MIGVPEEKTSERKVNLEIIEDISGTTAQNSPPEKGLLQTQPCGLAKPKHISVKLRPLVYKEECRKTFRARKQVFGRIRKSGGSDFSSQIKLEELSRVMFSH